MSSSALSAQRKALALLALVATAGSRGIARDKVLFLLWPESDTDQARNALSNLLFRLRRALGAEVIVGTAELRVEPACVSSDVAEFEQAVADGRFEQAAQLYTGAFLDGFHLREAPEFERWSADERSRLFHMFVDVLERLALSARQREDRAATITWSRKLAEADPLSARAARAYVDALAAGGDREAALRFAATYTALVRSELEVEPDADFVRRIEDLRLAPVVCLPPSLATAVPVEEISPTLGANASSLGAAAMRATGRWQRRRLLLAAVFGCAILIGAVSAIHARTSAVDSRRVVVARFDNRTGDSTLDSFGLIAADGVTQQLVRTGLVEVVDPASALAASRSVRATRSELGNLAAARVLARQTRARFVVSGDYYRDGADVVVQARVTDAAADRVVAATAEMREPLAARIALVDSVRQRIMGTLALLLDERLSTIIPAGNTPTYESYEQFIAGLEVFTTGALANAAPFFARAYALDTSFVQPLIWQAFAVQGNRASRDSVIRILEKHRASLSGIDRYALDYHIAATSGTLEQKLTAARGAARLAPGSHWTHNVATTLFALQRTREAVSTFETIDRENGWLRSWPGFWMGYLSALHEAGRHDDEVRIAHAARAVLPANNNLQRDEAMALAASGQWDEFNKRLIEIDQSLYGGWKLCSIASDLRLHGETTRARQTYDRAVRWYADRAATATADPDFNGARARALYGAGRWIEARPLIDDLHMQFPSNLEWLTLSALVAARMGDPTRAARLADSLVRSGSGDIAPERLNTAARIAAVLGQRERAVLLLEQTRSRSRLNLHGNGYVVDYDSLFGYAPFERMIATR